MLQNKSNECNSDNGKKNYLFIYLVYYASVQDFLQHLTFHAKAW